MADYQLIVIGAGPGGYTAAIRASQLGMRVALVENRELGGTCLNRGCIPTKTFLHTANLLRELNKCDTLGIRVEGVSVDIGRIYARKDEVVAQLRGGIEALLKANKVELIQGTALISDQGAVSVDGRKLTAENLLIAVGSKPARLPIPGLELPGVMTSDEFLADAGIPIHRLTIIGGGVIGVEFATIYQALGCEVTILEAMERILPGMDREISQNLAMILKKRGVKINTGARVQEVTKADALCCTYTVKDVQQTVEADRVLVSIGRVANTEHLLADGVDLHLDRGEIPVDTNFETCVKGIYAVGDVIKGGVRLAHAATAQGFAAVAHMCGQNPPADLSVVPACIYTDPEIACAGITAEEAKAAGIPVKTGKFLMSANGKSMIELADRGFVKLVCHAQTGVILGAQLMCSRATDLIAGISSAIVSRMTAEQLVSAIYPHPTFSEAIWEAAEDLDGRAVHVLPRR